MGKRTVPADDGSFNIPVVAVASVDPSTGKASPLGPSSPLPAVGLLTNVDQSATLTRPADVTAYTAGDLVADSTTAGSVTPLQFTIARNAAGSARILRARLAKSGTVASGIAFRLHLFAGAPTVANGDNGALQLATKTGVKYLGALDVFRWIGANDGALGVGAPAEGAELDVALASGQVVYGLMQALTAYTPASQETFAWTLEVAPN